MGDGDPRARGCSTWWERGRIQPRLVVVAGRRLYPRRTAVIIDLGLTIIYIATHSSTSHFYSTSATVSKASPTLDLTRGHPLRLPFHPRDFLLAFVPQHCNPTMQAAQVLQTPLFQPVALDAPPRPGTSIPRSVDLLEHPPTSRVGPLSDTCLVLCLL